MTSERVDEKSGAVFSVGVSRASLIPLVVMALVFGTLAGVGLFRKGSEMWGSGWLMRVAAICLALPAPLCLLTIVLASRVRLTLTNEGMVYQGPGRGWTLPWEALKGVVIHHVRTGHVMGLLDPPRMTDLPVGVIEFQTEEGRRCVRGMQVFRLDVEIEPLFHHVRTRWRARTGRETLELKRVMMGAGDAWSVR